MAKVLSFLGLMEPIGSITTPSMMVKKSCAGRRVCQEARGDDDGSGSGPRCSARRRRSIIRARCPYDALSAPCGHDSAFCNLSRRRQQRLARVHAVSVETIGMGVGRAGEVGIVAAFGKR